MSLEPYKIHGTPQFEHNLFQVEILPKQVSTWRFVIWEDKAIEKDHENQYSLSRSQGWQLEFIPTLSFTRALTSMPRGHPRSMVMSAPGAGRGLVAWPFLAMHQTIHIIDPKFSQ